MKTIFFISLVMLLISQWGLADSNNNATSLSLISPSSNKAKFIQMVAARLRSLWEKYSGEENKDTFIGRCFGAARKLKFIMPLIIFKLGVIMTILAFLTLFSLKSLALLGLLLLINVTGAVSKIAVALSGKHEEKKWKPPQNIHFHVHQSSEGEHHTGYISPGWEDRIANYDSSETSNSLENYNLYDKLRSKLFLKNYGDISR